MLTCNCGRNWSPDNKHSQLSQLCVIENSVIRTFERYTDGDASYKDAGEDSSHLRCCPLSIDVVRLFAEAAMDFSAFIFRDK
jgi:hypothetical protein